MATIKPFKALKFDSNIAGNLRDLISPPYDIISETQYQDYIKLNPYNIIRLELPKGKDPYNTAKSLLKNWLDSGVLKKDLENSFYIYEEEFLVNGETKKIKGFTSLVKLEEFSKKIILPHEETLSKAKEDRLNLMKSTSCNFSQIYSLYLDEENKTSNIIDTFSKSSPDIEVKDTEGIIHRIWSITNKEIINKIESQFKNRKLYIADGHHRYETAINYRNYCRKAGISKEGDPEDYIMMMLVDINNSGLVVFPTHRLIKNISHFDYNDIINQCKKYFEVEARHNISNIQKDLTELYNKNKKSFAFYYGNKMYTLLTLKQNLNLKEILPNFSESLLSLDVTILHSLILEKLFGIDKENMKNQCNLAYTRNLDEAISSVDNGAFQCAFILNPTRVEEIKNVALDSKKMPQKSTYFYPKLITGLIMNQINPNI